MFLKIWRTGPFRVTMRQYVWLFRGHKTGQSKRIPSWMSKHDVFCSILKRLNDDHHYLSDPFCAITAFKPIVGEAKKQAVRELTGKRPDSLGIKSLIATTAPSACRNRQLGAVMRCGEAWVPIGDCFEQITYE